MRPKSDKADTDLLESFALARRLLAAHFGHEDFLPGQEPALESVLSGRNLLVVMPTGSGKSLIYQLPSLMDDGLTIVVSPLISLMKDQVDELRRIGLPATSVNSSLGRDEQRARLSACMKGEYRILYVAPERCRDGAFLGILGGIEVSRLAVDEAHCISEWGHDFRPDYRKLKTFRERVGCPPVTALTATATARVQQDIIESLGLPATETDVHVHGFDRSNLDLSVVMGFNDEKKIDFLRSFLRKNEGSGIIYAGTRRTTEELVDALRSVEPAMVAYHAGMEPDERTAAQEAFLGGEARVVIATSAFGMGIDKRDVRFVIHYNYPGSVEQYYQEVGRAGRDGLDSRCVLLYSSADQSLREFFIDVSYPSRAQVRSVYDAIWETPENPVLLTYKQIARLCDESVSEGQVGTAVRMLDGAGVLRAFSGEPKVAVTLAKPYSEIRPLIRGPQQQRVLEALASSADLEKRGRFEIGLYRLATDARISVDQVRRALAALREGGLAGYEPPFRGRGIEKLVGPPLPFEKLPIDWKRHEVLRGIEEKRLQAMERFITHPGCRRGFILRYFGERQSFSCGTCDYCRKTGPGRRGAASIVERNPRVALPVLACVRFMRFPVGKGRITEVVTGSRKAQLLEWKLDRNPAYGLVCCRQDEVKEVIEHLILEGYLEVRGESGFPVLGLTPLGKKVALELSLGQLQRVAAGEGEEAGRGDASRRGSARSETSRVRAGRGGGRGRASTDEEMRRKVLECVDTLPFPLGAVKIAAVLTGSRAKWIEEAGLKELDVYGSVNETQERVVKVIKSMQGENLLARGGRPHRPTLELAQRGRTELGRAPRTQDGRAT